jgi:hypothetical protein
MDPTISQKIGPWLERDERLLWSGRPGRGIVFKAGDVFLIPFCVVWCGFVIFWHVGVYRSNAPLFFLLFGALFVVVGLYFVIGRFIWDAFRRARTVYAVTNRRIVIVSDVWRRELRSLELEGLSQIQFREGRDGRGTITFGDKMAWWAEFSTMPGTRPSAPEFEAIDHARAVMDTIREAQRRL